MDSSECIYTLVSSEMAAPSFEFYKNGVYIAIQMK